jgi:hypothetical protein
MRNPARRSRKIGLTEGGRVIDGRPLEKWSRAFPPQTWEKLAAEGPKGRIIRENPSRNYFHPCSADEIREVLKKLPAKLTDQVSAIVLRRTPKIDEHLAVEARCLYRCVILNAFPKDCLMRWPERPPQAALRHYGWWCAKPLIERKGQWLLQWTREELKQYYLYHLLLHEIGHINDPHRRSRKRREEYAEQFALEWARKLGVL